MANTVDLSVLRMLRDLSPKDTTFMPRVVQTFISDATPQVEELKRRLAAGEAPEVYRLAHGLLSSAQNVGATAFANGCLEMQNLGKMSDLTHAASILPKVLHAFQETKRIFEEILKSGNLPEN